MKKKNEKNHVAGRIAAGTALLLSAALLLSGCSSGVEMTGATKSTEQISPAIELLRRKQAAGLSFCTPRYEDKVFSEAEFTEKLGVRPEYIVVNTLPQPDAGTLLLNGRAVLEGQTIPASSLDFLRLIPAEGKEEAATFLLTAKADGWENTPMLCRVALLEHENFAPVAQDVSLETLSGVCCFADLSALATDPDGDGVEYRVITYPKHGTVEFRDGKAVYRPVKSFRGKDSFAFEAVDIYGARSRECTVSMDVSENETGILFADLQDSPAHLAAIGLCADSIMTYRMENGEYRFEPDGEVSKIDLLVMMMCLRGLSGEVSAVADTEAVDDAGLSSGKKGFLQYAIAKGIVRLEDGKFAPNEPATAADAAFMAQKLLGLPTLAAKQKFSDLGDVPAWAEDALVTMDAAGVFRRDGALDAGQKLTRVDVVEILDAMKGDCVS